MSVSYQQMLHNVALRANTLVGTQSAALETTYATAVLNSGNFLSADWPFSAHRDAILMAEEEFAWAIADTGGHPWRRTIGGVTAALADAAELPAVSSTGVPIIGVWGSVIDGSDSKPLTEQPLDVVRREKAETWRVYPVYHYKFDDGRIFHTRTTVVIQCCVYNRTTQLAAWNAAGNMLLPDVLELAVTARALSIMTRDNNNAEQARVYRDYSNQALELIRKGLITVPSKTLPGPTLAT